jgi:O-antigen ligase/polysaccharide polymerase Wzy-like membrane protein
MAIAPPRPARTRRVVSLSLGSAAIVGLGLAAVVAYAAFADGAIALPMEARLQVGIAALALGALGALLFVRGMRASAPASGWGGLGLLVAFAAFSGLSFAWSIAPDGTWSELNRAISYLLVTAVALVVGSSLTRPLERAALAFLAIAGVVALYALAGKAIPGVHIGPVDFNHTAFFSRLRAPLAYWNALSLFCVLAVPVALRAASERRRAALVVAVLLLTTVGLTYSRGGVGALVVALAVALALGPDRLRLATATAAAVIGAAPALAVGFTRHDLTHDLVPVAQREGDGLLFLAALVVGVGLAVAIDHFAGTRVERLAPLPRRRVLALAGIAAALAVVLTVAGLAASQRGVSGTITHGFDSFKSVKFDRQNDPSRILETNSGNRWVWWSEAVGAWSDRPLAGWGAGSFPLLHHRYRHNALEVLQPHSVPLQFLAEVGLIGALLGLGALALLTTAGVKRVANGVHAERSGVPAGREHRYAVALLAAVAAWLVHMWFDWDWDIPGVAVPLFVFLGLLGARPLGMAGHGFGPVRASTPLSPRLAALALGAALAAAIAISAALPSLARDRTNDATGALARGDFAEAVRQADVAQRLDPVAVDPLLLEARAAGRSGQFTLASQVLTEAVQRQPDNPNVWLGVARLELARGDISAMRAAAQRMLVLDPVAPAGTYFFLLNDLGVRSATATGTPLP